MDFFVVHSEVPLSEATKNKIEQEMNEAEAMLYLAADYEGKLNMLKILFEKQITEKYQRTELLGWELKKSVAHMALRHKIENMEEWFILPDSKIPGFWDQIFSKWEEGVTFDWREVSPRPVNNVAEKVLDRFSARYNADNGNNSANQRVRQSSSRGTNKHYKTWLYIICYSMLSQVQKLRTALSIPEPGDESDASMEIYMQNIHDFLANVSYICSISSGKIHTGYSDISNEELIAVLQKTLVESKLLQTAILLLTEL